MGLEKPVSGAWQEIESINKPVNGAWEECEAVCKPVNGAWEEIWNAIKTLIRLSNSISNGVLDIQNEGLKFYYSKNDDVSGSGTITFYTEGKWTNPVISFDYEGYFYRTNASETTWYTNSAGSISLYSRTTDGTETTTEVVSSVGVSESGSLDESDGWEEKGSYSGTLEGTFDRLGLSIHVTGYSYVSSTYNVYLVMKILNVLINSTKIAFPVSAEFDYE